MPLVKETTKWREVWTKEEWRTQGDDFRTLLGDFVAALPQVEFPSGLRL
jgi:hypothetical protein